MAAPARATFDPELAEVPFAEAVDPTDDGDAASNEEVEDPCPDGDADGDGICDEVEIRSGTEPLFEDSDGDGIPDGVEDANQDGIVDEGESDPRVPGLFPGSYPHIPEPMVFDLVRALGAERGELEVNTLAIMKWHRARPAFLWAPEIEWAFAKGVAIEFELPMENRELESVKLAFQATLPAAARNFTHGVQVIGEYYLTPKEAETTLLYLAGARASRWSFFSMFGVRGLTPLDENRLFEAVVNPSAYYDVTEWYTMGIETNIAIDWTGHTKVAIIPQLHFQVTRHFRVQLGGGAAFVDGRVDPLIATRVIVE